MKKRVESVFENDNICIINLAEAKYNLVELGEGQAYTIPSY